MNLMAVLSVSFAKALLADIITIALAMIITDFALATSFFSTHFVLFVVIYAVIHALIEAVTSW